MTGRVIAMLLGMYVLAAVGCSGMVLEAGSSSSSSSELSNSNSQTGEKTPAKPVEMERVIAEAGVGKKGQALREEGVNKTIAGPLSALRMTEQKVVFDQAKYAVELYRAQHGDVPKTHDDYMKKIIQANNLKLPELPEGHSYIWVAEDKTLYVERPKQQ